MVLPLLPSLLLQPCVKVAVGNDDCLGVQIGVDSDLMSSGSRLSWPNTIVCSSLSSPRISLTRSPSSLLGPACSSPRITSPAPSRRGSKAALSAFDDRLLGSLQLRFGLPSPLPDKALLSLRQPIREGGFGIRSMWIVSTAAFFSSSVQSARDTDPLFARHPESPPTPFALARTACNHTLVAAGVPVTLVEFSTASHSDDVWCLLPTLSTGLTSPVLSSFA